MIKDKEQMILKQFADTFPTLKVIKVKKSNEKFCRDVMANCLNKLQVISFPDYPEYYTSYVKCISRFGFIIDKQVW